MHDKLTISLIYYTQCMYSLILLWFVSIAVEELIPDPAVTLIVYNSGGYSVGPPLLLISTQISFFFYVMH